MKRITPVFIFLICFSSFSFSQYYINLTKTRSRANLEKIKLKNKTINIIIQESDAMLIYLIRDSAMRNLDFKLYFDENKKCYKEQTNLTCDSCYNIFLENTLSTKNIRWVKINSSTYFARFPYRLILNTKIDKEFSFEISRSNLIGKEYRTAIRKALSKN